MVDGDIDVIFSAEFTTVCGFTVQDAFGSVRQVSLAESKSVGEITYGQYENNAVCAAWDVG